MLTTGIAVGAGLFAASAAAADTPASGVKAVLENTMLGGKIDIEGGDTVDGGLFTLKTSDGEIQAYCIEAYKEVYLGEGTKYFESDWQSISRGDKNALEATAKVRWILENSYPQVKDLSALAKTVGVDSLTPQDAAAATQAAIWKISDNLNAIPRDAEAKKLRDYLLSDVNKGIADEPDPSLTLTPESGSGESGGRLGPFTLNSSASEVELAVTGDGAGKVKVMDKNGKPIGATLAGPIAKDTQLFLDVPAGTPDGSVALAASAKTVVPTGRVLLSEGYEPENHSQTMVLAGSSKLSVSVDVKATWKQGKGADTGTPAPSGTPAPQGTPAKAATPTGTPAKAGAPTGTPAKAGAPTGTPAKAGAPSAGPSTTAAQSAPVPSSTPRGTGALAQTGANESIPILAAVAGGLVVAGGSAVFILRRGRQRRRHAS
ncbi:TQXA domain-containing protein [Streptomyces sp. WAC07061]|uniref:Cys-Gln thioester bond-forming surface protein n=1 Tax=Streptomyces sp. WAC07061 TaxID=2487410 RepID=UPI000F774979|nr:Cys-Gln thioester bond-forming surface protein [Streptomyces sp. WAC07061]RSS64127.1 TQXA domain-containing protein [Streptomyces sp. WAC07061]